MTDLLIGAGCVFVLLAIPAVRWCMYEWRQMAHAKHIVRVTEEEAAPEPWFYGSMNLEDERDWHLACAVDHRGEPCPGYPDWHTATMAELSPEALDPGPGGDASSPTLPPPGPDQDDDPEPYESDEEFIASVAHLLPLEAVVDEVITLEPPEWERLTSPASLAPVWERLADTGDIRDAALLADTTTYMRDQDAEVADWMARRAAEWARLEIGVLA